MRAVLDEGVPDDIVAPLTSLGAAVDPFRQEWRGLANGVLLNAVERAQYSVLVTNDKNMGFQLNLRRLRIAIVALPINRPDVLVARAKDILECLRLARPGQALWLGMDGRRLVRSADATGTIVTDELPRLPPFRG